MSKYDGLGKFLSEQELEVVPMTFAKIEQVTGTKLPASKRYPAWWSNFPDNNVMTPIWLDAGFRTEQVDIEGQRLVFRRVVPKAQGKAINQGKGDGMSDVTVEFKSDDGAEKKSRRSPLFGALKGTFSIDPGWDITQPAMDADELAEMDANIERTADLIDAGMSGRHK
jgi:hypothetical protein